MRMIKKYLKKGIHLLNKDKKLLTILTLIYWYNNDISKYNKLVRQYTKSNN